MNIYCITKIGTVREGEQEGARRQRTEEIAENCTNVKKLFLQMQIFRDIFFRFLATLHERSATEGAMMIDTVE